MSSSRKEKRNLVILTACFLFFLFVCGRTCYYGARILLVASGAERLTCELDEYDFGDVTCGERPEYVFRIKNVGRRPVPIQSVSPSCSSCVEVAECSLEPMIPGETREIAVTLLSDNLTGEVKKSALVKYGGLTRQYLPLYLRARVVAKGAAPRAPSGATGEEESAASASARSENEASQ